MKKLLQLIVFLSFAPFSWAQITDPEKKSLEQLSADFAKINISYQAEIAKLTNLKSSISENSDPTSLSKTLSDQLEESKKYKLQLDSIYELYLSYKKIYLSKGIKEDDIDKIFPQRYTISNTKNSENIPDTKTYIYFGKGKVIEEKDSLFKNENANIIFEDILNAKSESYLGDFTIPKNEQKVPYEYVTRERGFLKKKQKTKAQSYLKFKSIKIHLYEGSLYDIKLIVTDNNNKEYLFENQHPVSLLRYSIRNFNRFLYCNPIEIESPLEKVTDENKLLYYQIRLSDVLEYVANPGNNYVPEDEVLEFPSIIKDVETNKNQPVKYKMIANTALQNIVELRTYTDFLGLFSDDTPNGVIQLEGKGDFYVAPFNPNNTTLYIFKKISPFVNFSRIDKDIRNLTLEEAPDNKFTIQNSLQIVEKSYLQMGLNLSFISFKIAKEYPFEINFYGTTKYQISDVMSENKAVNYKSLGIGGGIALEFKRYNNFGFIYSAELTNYNSKSFNDFKDIINPASFLVFQNKAEVYFFPGETKQQAIFLRFKTFNNSEKDNNEAFYQLQFGYRFSIGIGKIKD
ncbi:hypothetical protein [Flavobacterium sp. KBS0721]|uniref:hypothetical protein n=1 Tax=Flavobacterium sp. KBS0721 TaxID=1179672 RepID=UPI00098FBB1D|nr:hypothetical protein [Flavobacterium sp. KBS0721]QDW22767.1 hypothetical protein B0M43_0022470 [Flavobacterium sp. KBS0721]